MLNIPTLRKLAAAIKVVGWLNITLVPLAVVLNTIESGAFPIGRQGASSRHDIFSLLQNLRGTGTLYWERPTKDILVAVGFGMGLLALAQLIRLAIKGWEHLRSLDEAAQGQTPTPTEAGQQTSDLPKESPRVHVLSRAMLILGCIGIVLLVAFPLDFMASGSIIHVWSLGFRGILLRAPVLGMGFVRGLAYALALIALSQVLLWAKEAVRHLKGLADLERQAGEEGQREGQS